MHEMEWIFDLGVILFAAKIGGEIFQRLGMSAVVGEIAAGVVVGHSVLNLVPASDVISHDLINHLAELGVIFMIFLLGLETKVTHMMEVGVTAALVALGGLLVPLACGHYLGLWLGLEWQAALVMGALLMATSVAISTRVFLDCGMGRSKVTQTIIAAAVIDDVVGLIILTIILALTGQSESEIGLGLLLSEQGLLLFVGFPVALFVLPRLLRWVRKLEGEGALFVLVLSATLLFAYGGVPAGMEPIIGAFLVGVIFGSTPESGVIERQVTPLVHFLAPIFFVHVGLLVDLGALSTGFWLALGLTAVAALTKLVGCGGVAMLRGMTRRDSMLVGVGMIPRGEVGLIIAGIGARMGIFDDKIYSAAALMCVLTILVVPPVLKPLARKAAPEGQEAPA